jgi:ribosomal protein S30
MHANKIGVNSHQSLSNSGEISLEIPQNPARKKCHAVMRSKNHINYLIPVIPKTWQERIAIYENILSGRLSL